MKLGNFRNTIERIISITEDPFIKLAKKEGGGEGGDEEEKVYGNSPFFRKFNDRIFGDRYYSFDLISEMT